MKLFFKTIQFLISPRAELVHFFPFLIQAPKLIRFVLEYLRRVRANRLGPIFPGHLAFTPYPFGEVD
jgi:hypothetical protein